MSTISIEQMLSYKSYTFALGVMFVTLFSCYSASAQWTTNTGTGDAYNNNSSGNVGIGTATPDAPIHVKGGSAMSGGWNRTQVLQATFPVLVFESADNKWAGIGYDYSVDALRFWTGAASDNATTGNLTMTMTGGNIGIGTGSPDRVLTVAGNSGLDV